MRETQLMPPESRMEMAETAVQYEPFPTPASPKENPSIPAGQKKEHKIIIGASRRLMEVCLQAINTQSTHTNITKRPSEQVPCTQKHNSQLALNCPCNTEI